MALDVDGFVALGAIARSPEVFPDIRADLARTVRSLVVKQLKVKNLTLDGLRRVRRCLGTETYALIFDGLTASMPLGRSCGWCRARGQDGSLSAATGRIRRWGSERHASPRKPCLYRILGPQGS
jgi:hypothetical protein